MNDVLGKDGLYRYLGDLSQIFYAKQYRVIGGKGDGMRMVDVNNGAGIEFSVLVDRAMDIGRFSINGKNCAYLSKSGLCAPAYYDDQGAGWLKTFGGGFLATCGLTQAGAPCTSDGEALGLHGPIGAAPAEDFCCWVDLESLVPEIVLKGRMRCARALGEELWMTREIRVKYGENAVYIRDVVENRGARALPYMILYHMNLGYPLLQEGVALDTNAEYFDHVGDYPQESIENRLVFPNVQDDGIEEVYYYNAAKATYAGVWNEQLGIGINICFDGDQLPHMAQWKYPLAGDYAMGIEPSNCLTKGREEQKKYGLAHIGPYETKVQELKIEART